MHGLFVYSWRLFPSGSPIAQGETPQVNHCSFILHLWTTPPVTADRSRLKRPGFPTMATSPVKEFLVTYVMPEKCYQEVFVNLQLHGEARRSVATDLCRCSGGWTCFRLRSVLNFYDNSILWPWLSNICSNLSLLSSQYRASSFCWANLRDFGFCWTLWVRQCSSFYCHMEKY